MPLLKFTTTAYLHRRVAPRHPCCKHKILYSCTILAYSTFMQRTPVRCVYEHARHLCCRLFGAACFPVQCLQTFVKIFEIIATASVTVNIECGMHHPWCLHSIVKVSLWIHKCKSIKGLLIVNETFSSKLQASPTPPMSYWITKWKSTMDSWPLGHTAHVPCVSRISRIRKNERMTGSAFGRTSDAFSYQRKLLHKKVHCTIFVCGEGSFHL